MGVGNHILLVKAPGFYQKGLNPTGMAGMFGPASTGEPPPDSPMVVVGADVEQVEGLVDVFGRAFFAGVGHQQEACFARLGKDPLKL